MEVQEKDGITIISMDERFDTTVSQRVKDTVRNLAEQNQLRLVIDLSKTRFIDSSGCGALVASLRAMMKNNGRMKVSNPSAQARSLFQLTRLHKVFEIYDDLDAAVKAFGEDS